MSLCIATYNCCGLGPGKIEYITQLCSEFDFLCVQETWLLSENTGIFSSKIPGISTHGISSMDSRETLSSWWDTDRMEFLVGKNKAEFPIGH